MTTLVRVWGVQGGPPTPVPTGESEIGRGVESLVNCAWVSRGFCDVGSGQKGTV